MAQSKRPVSICSLGKNKILPYKVALKESGDETVCFHCRRAQLALSCLKKVFEAFGFVCKENSESAVLRQLPKYHTMSEKDELIDYLKYKISAVFAWSRDQPMPVPSEKMKAVCEREKDKIAHVLIGGGYYSFCEMMKKFEYPRNPKRAYGFFYSLLMCKKGLPRVSDNALRKAEWAALVTMTTPMERKFSDMEVINRVGKRLQETIKRMFRPKDWTAVEMRWPSQSAHMFAKRACGGALGELRDGGYLPPRHVFFSTEQLRYERNMCMMELRLKESEECRVNNDAKRYDVPEAMADELVIAQWHLANAAWNEYPVCCPVALPEPCKIRTITKGPSRLYAAVKPIQEMMIATLKKDKRFCVGGPISGKLIGEVLGDLLPGCKYLSGDYKAATDNIAIELSNLAIETIADCTEMPDLYRDLLRRSLTEHWYTCATDEYGDKCQILPKPVAQARGQLMGSPTSFPILCLINFALIWAACYPVATFDQVCVMVNGDDCLFQCTDEERLEWERCANAVGLTPSVGKTYYSEDFVVMNSELYLTKSWEYIPYLNMGLLSGMRKSGEMNTIATGDEDTIGARAAALVRGYDGPMRKWILKEFIELCVKDISFEENGKRIKVCIPWNVSERWSGLGLPDEDLTFIAGLEERQYKFDRRTERALIHLINRDKEYRSQVERRWNSLNKGKEIGQYKEITKPKYPRMKVRDDGKAPYYDRTTKWLEDYYGTRILRDDEVFNCDKFLFGFSQKSEFEVYCEEMTPEEKKAYRKEMALFKNKQLKKVHEFWLKAFRQGQKHVGSFDAAYYESGPVRTCPAVDLTAKEPDLRLVGYSLPIVGSFDGHFDIPWERTSELARQYDYGHRYTATTLRKKDVPESSKRAPVDYSVNLTPMSNEELLDFFGLEREAMEHIATVTNFEAYADRVLYNRRAASPLSTPGAFGLYAGEELQKKE